MAHASRITNTPGRSLTPIEILVVESNPVDAQKTLTQFRAAGLTNGPHSVLEGEDALRYLRREGPHADARVPDLIFLDLLLPKMSGLRALKVIKSTPALMHVPVVVAAESDDVRFVQAVCSLSAHGFIRKPAELIDFLRSIEPCYEYWISVVTLNSKARAGDQSSVTTAARLM